MADAPEDFDPSSSREAATGETIPKSKLERLEEGSTLTGFASERQASGSVVAEGLPFEPVTVQAPHGEVIVGDEAHGKPPFAPRKAPTKAARERGGVGPDGGVDELRPAAWVFYANEERAHGKWREDIQPGRVMFWRHGLAEYERGGASYSKTMRRGDRVIVLVDDEIVATAVLAGDGRMKFGDQANARWWPIQFVEVFERPLSRQAVQEGLGRDLVPNRGSVHPIEPDEIDRLAGQMLAMAGVASLWPDKRSEALALVAKGALRQAALDWPELEVDADTRKALLLDAPGALPPVINDTHEAPDLLGIDPEVTAFARLAVSKRIEPPLSIGMFGDWGSGKSFFMEKIKAKIDGLARRAEDPADPSHALLHHRVPQIRFNAWHYIETNLWASLVEFIFAELDRWLKQHDVPAAEVDALFDRLATSRRLKLEAYAQLVKAKKDEAAAREALETAKADHRKAQAVPLTAAQIWTAAAAGFLAEVEDQDREQLKAIGETLGVADLEASGEAAARLVREAGEQSARGRIVLESIVARAGAPQAAALIVAALLGPPLVMWGLSLWLPKIFAGAPQILAAAAATLSGLTLLARKGLELARGQLAVLDRLRGRLDKAVEDKTKEERDRLEAGQALAAKTAQAVVEAERRATEAGDRVAALLREQSEMSASGRLNRFIRDKAANGDYARHLGIVASVHKDFAQLSALLGAQDTLDPLQADKVEAARKAHRDAAEALIKEAGDASAPLTDAQKADLREEALGNHAPPGIGRIVLYIDDLDRCPPDKVVDVLQAIHMLLYFKLFVVFVAVDARWLKRSLDAQFDGLIEDDNHGPGVPGGEKAANAQDYLEKIFQIPFSVTPMDEAASANFVRDLTRDLVKREAASGAGEDRDGGARDGAGARGSAPDPFDDLPPGQDGPLLDADAAAQAGLLAIDLTPDEQAALQAFGATLGGSPRRTKRFVNTYLLIKIALLQKPNLPQAESTALCLAALLAVVVGARRAAPAFFQQVGRWERLDLLKSGLREELQQEGGPSYASLEPVLTAMSNNPGSFDPIAARDLAPIVRRYAF